MSTLKRENNIIYLGGKPHKYSDVVMLPTNEKAPQIGMISTTNDGKLQSVDKGLVDMYTFHQQFGDFAPVIPYQHLYFLSDEEIKEGDWVLTPNNEIKKFGQVGTYLSKDKKIIATTDKSICDAYKTNWELKAIPQPSESFIEAFIEAYNKGQQIKRVLMEYERGNWEHRIILMFTEDV